MRAWVKVLVIMVLLPILVGGAVLFVAGRPLAFEILQRRTASKFPEVRWIERVRIEPYRPSLRPLRGFPKDTPMVVYSSAGYRVREWQAG